MLLQRCFECCVKVRLCRRPYQLQGRLQELDLVSSGLPGVSGDPWVATIVLETVSESVSRAGPEGFWRADTVEIRLPQPLRIAAPRIACAGQRAAGNFFVGLPWVSQQCYCKHLTVACNIVMGSLF